MLTLLKNGYVYAPEDLGKRDVLLCAGKIVHMEDTIELAGLSLPVQVIDAGGMLAVPGFIDAHVHITGGGAWVCGAPWLLDVVVLRRNLP